MRVSSWQRKEAEDTPQKQLRTRTTPMTKNFLEIHLPKPKPCYIVWKRAAAGIALHVNAENTEYMCFNQRGDISSLNGTSLKLGDTFTYLGNSVSSTEKDINTRLEKAWKAIDRLSVI